MAIALAELVYSELIGLVQRTRVSYPACFNKIRLTENMVDKRESYTKEDLLASGRGELFGAKGPQLPAPNMLMMDRVVKMTETGGNFDKGYVEAELDINPDLWFFGCHFIGDPVMPGCLGLDAMWQLVGFYLGWLGGEGKGRALGVGEVKFTGQVLPTAKKAIESGKLGEIVEVESHFDYYRPVAETKPGLPQDGAFYGLGVHTMDQIISLFGRPDHVAYDIRSLRNKANPDDTFEAQLFYGDLKAIVKTSHLVKIDYPKFIVHGKKGSFIKYGIDQQETSLKANIMPGEPGFAADDSVGVLEYVNDEGVTVREEM